MSNTVPKWTEERTAMLTSLVGDETPVSRDTVAEAAERLETSTRSIGSKLRKMGYEVAKVAEATRSFSAEQEAELEGLVTDNSGQLTYAQIAEQFQGGAFSAKVVQGKILSMELTEHVRPAEPKVVERKYSPEEEAQFVALAGEGAFIEDIAEAMGREVNSIRGKALSLLRQEQIAKIPPQRNKVEREAQDAFEGLNIGEMTVEAIAEATDKSVRGVKSMLTRRGLTAANYDGAAKKEKRAQAAA